MKNVANLKFNIKHKKTLLTSVFDMNTDKEQKTTHN